MDNGEQWADLSDQYTQADKDFHDAWNVVVKKFGAIAAGKSRENPTEEELNRLDEVRTRREAIEKRMHAFMKSHFG
jgi:hypothetical protein